MDSLLIHEKTNTHQGDKGHGVCPANLLRHQSCHYPQKGEPCGSFQRKSTLDKKKNSWTWALEKTQIMCYLFHLGNNGSVHLFIQIRGLNLLTL